MRTLLLLRGAPASGKSTFVKKNGLEGYTLSLDDFRDKVSPRVYTELAEASHQLNNDFLAWEALLMVLEMRMRNGLFTIIDATHNNNDAVKRYSALADKYKYTLFYYQMETTFPQILENNKNRSSLKEREFIEPEVLKNIHTLVTTEPLFHATKIDDLSEIMPFRTINTQQYKQVKVIGSIAGNAVLFSKIMSEAKNNPDCLYIFTGCYFGFVGTNKIKTNFLKASHYFNDMSAIPDDLSHVLADGVIFDELAFNHFSRQETNEQLFGDNQKFAEIWAKHNVDKHISSKGFVSGNKMIYDELVSFVDNIKQHPNIILLESGHETIWRELNKTPDNTSLMFDLINKRDYEGNDDGYLSEYRQIVSNLKNIYKRLQQCARLNINGKKVLVSHAVLPTFSSIELTKVDTNQLIGLSYKLDDEGHPVPTRSNVKFLFADTVETFDGLPVDSILINACMGANRHSGLSNEAIIGLNVNNAQVQVLSIDTQSNNVFETLETYRNEFMSIVDRFDYAQRENVTGVSLPQQRDKKEEQMTNKRAFIVPVVDKRDKYRKGKKRISQYLEIPFTDNEAVNQFIVNGLAKGLLDIKLLGKDKNLLAVNFNEDAFWNKAWDSTTMKARGLFLDAKTGEVKIRSYNKFFNYKENTSTSPQVLEKTLVYPVRAYHKYNGFLGIVSVIDDELIYASKSQINGFHVDLLKDLFETTIPANEREALKSLLRDNQASLTLEVCHLRDPHIIKYEQSFLIGLDFIPLNGMIDQSPYALDVTFSDELRKKCETVCPSLKFKSLDYVLNNWSEVQELIAKTENDDLEIEGYVLQDANGYQFKLKCQYYKMWKGLRHWIFSKNIKLGASKNSTEISFLTWFKSNKSGILSQIDKENRNKLSIIDWREMWMKAKS